MNTQENPRYSAKDFYTYGVRIQSLGANATLPGSFTVDADADFNWQKGLVFADVGNASTNYSAGELPNCTITINDQSSGRNLMNIPVPLSSLFGTGQLPFILPTSKIFQARGSVSVSITNLTTTVYTNIFLSFVGTKLFLR